MEGGHFLDALKRRSKMSRNGSFTLWLGVWALFAAVFFSGCAGEQKALEEQIARQNETIEELQRHNAELQTRLAGAEKKDTGGQAELEAHRQALESELKGIGVAVATRGDQLVITLPSARLFGPGQATIKPKAQEPLAKVAKAINAKLPTAIVRIEGHTDNQPIKKSKKRYKSNWELSAARATTVLNFFVKKCHMNPKKVYLAGFGQYHPVASNATSEGRQKNRRVEIVILTGGKT